MVLAQVYRNSVRAHSRRKNAFGGKTKEPRRVTLQSISSPPTCTPGIRMSDSDNQNASARDYDEGDEAISNSSSPSTGGSTFNQIDEVERVSPFPEEKDGSARPTASSEDVSSAGPGKSPRVVLSKMFPQLAPHEAEQIGAGLPQKAIPRELRYGRQNPAPGASSRPRTLPASGEASSSVPDPRLSSTSSAPVATSSSDPNAPEADQNADALPATRKKMVFLNSEVVQQQKCLLTRAEFPKRTRALTDTAAKISSEVYDYRIFRTPEGYKSANLEPPDYGRDEKYEPVPLSVPTTGDTIAEPSQGMSPERAFIAPAAAPRPKTKAASKPTADPPVVNVPDTVPIDSSSGGGAAPDLQVALGPSRRGKEKRQETEVEEIRDKVPGLETIMGWSCNRLGEQIAEDILRLSHTTTELFSRARALEGIREKEVVPLQKQVSAAERRIQELDKELAAAEDRAEKAEKKLGEAEARADKAEKAEQEAIDKMKDASSLARFICTDEAIAKEFLTAFINTEVWDKLTWVYGQWAFSSGCQAIEEKVHTALVEGLEESDLPAVMALLPDKVADPGPRPYSKPGPSE
nr:serine/arginine repetitive matrix protein 2-like [Ipomoea batatas]